MIHIHYHSGIEIIYPSVRISEESFDSDAFIDRKAIKTMLLAVKESTYENWTGYGMGR